ncbi:MAG: FHA domain-containing protein [Phycisphaerales bacterium]|nr:FHA domain-containing protein [Phycisphaerales bacterium]
MLVLTIISGPDKGKRFELTEPSLIGRSSEALRTSDPSISRRHAELTPDDGRWFISDLDSSNGTYVNGTRITERTRVTPGDHIRTGSTLFLCGQIAPDVGDRRLIELLHPDRIESEVEKTQATGDDSAFLPTEQPEADALDQLRIVYRLTQLTTHVYDRQSLLKKVLDLVFDEFLPDRGFVLLLGSGRNDPQPAVVRHRKMADGPKSEKIRVSRTIVRHVIGKREGVLCTNARTDARFAGSDSIDALPTRSAICVPIQFYKHVFGVLYIDTAVRSNAYSEAQLALLTAIGQHTGLALQNAEMYQAQIRTERLAAVGETVASLSHSIKNILQGLRGGADVLEMGIKKEDLRLARGGWDVLSRNLDRIYSLTMNMLAFTKRTPLEIELTKPRPLMEECAELIKAQCDRKGVALIVDADPDMPPIPMDPNAMHQAIMNLLTNALQSVDAKTGIITLRSEYEAAEAMREGGKTPALARIIVADNGSGIAPDQMPRIFEAFYSTKGIRGTGLGLAVTKKIIEEHSGSIASRSSEQDGTIFTLVLPTSVSHGLDPAETTTPGSADQDGIGGL